MWFPKEKEVSAFRMLRRTFHACFASGQREKKINKNFHPVPPTPTSKMFFVLEFFTLVLQLVFARPLYMSELIGMLSQTTSSGEQENCLKKLGVPNEMTR